MTAWTATTVKPVIWMDAASFVAGVWRDKSGRGNDSARVENVSVSNNALSGGANSGVDIVRGWPGGEYTFFHVTRYTGGARGRIWNGKNGNWLSGHWGGHAGWAHHDRWLEPKRDLPVDNWVLTVDQRSYARFNATNESRAEGTNPRGVGINQFGGQYNNERSDWACAEIVVFEGNLSDADVRAVENYLINKYGMPFKSVAPAPAPASGSWVRMAGEGGRFNANGVVRYGMGGTWTQKEFNGSVGCDNGTFGDPLPGTVKECQLMVGGRPGKLVEQKYNGYYNDNFGFFNNAQKAGAEAYVTQIRKGDEGSRYSYRWTGTIRPRASGQHEFWTRSDDASHVLVDGNVVVDNRGVHGPVDRSGAINLSADRTYRFEVYFGENEGGAEMWLQWHGPNQGWQTDMASILA